MSDATYAALLYEHGDEHIAEDLVDAAEEWARDRARDIRQANPEEVAAILADMKEDMIDTA